MNPTRWKMALPRMILGLMLCVTLLVNSSCLSRTRTVYLETTDPVRIRKPVQAEVWVKDASGNWVESEVELKEGSWNISSLKE
jgi:hypothetical protein